MGSIQGDMAKTVELALVAWVWGSEPNNVRGGELTLTLASCRVNWCLPSPGEDQY